MDVPTTTLDDFCSRHAIDRVNVLKMDIQGGELMALQGASGMLESKAVDLIYTEVLFVELYEGQADFHDLCRFLCDCDYTLYGLYDLNSGRDSILAWGDAIFIAPRVRQSLDRTGVAKTNGNQSDPPGKSHFRDWQATHAPRNHNASD